MSTEPTPTPNRTPDWAVIALFALLAGAAIYTLYNAFVAQADLNRRLQADHRTLAAQFDTLKAAQARGDASAKITLLEQQLADSQRSVATLTERLAVLEKTASMPAPTIQFTAPPATDTALLQRFTALKQAVGSGAPFAPALEKAASIAEVAAIRERLAPFAAEGIASESQLRDQLDMLLTQQQPPAPAEAPEFARLNDTLKGLLHIRRAQPAAHDPYATLRAQSEAGASLDVLRVSVGELDDAARAPFAAWQTRAQTRLEALAALTAAEMALTTPQPAP